MTYLAIKYLHMFTALLSIAGFAWRGALRLRGSALLERRWLRIVPHINDTVLLGAGIYLALVSAQYPLAQPWLSAKLAGLVVYIGLGLYTMRFAPTTGRRALAYVLALLTFAYMVAVAFTRSAWPL